MTQDPALIDRILDDADVALAEQDRLREALRMSEARVRALCRSYDLASGSHGVRPEGLRRAVEMRRASRAA